MTRRGIRISLVMLATLLIDLSFGRAADVLLVTSSTENNLNSKVETVCRFYGLDLYRLHLPDDPNTQIVRTALQEHKPQAVIINVAVFNGIKQFERLMGEDKKVSLLVADIDTAADTNLLASISDGVIMGCVNPGKMPATGFLSFAAMTDLTHQLAGRTLPIFDHEWYGLDIKVRQKGRTVIEIADHEESQAYPIFLKTFVTGRELFFLSKNNKTSIPKSKDAQSIRDMFYDLVPIMIFLRHALGDKCWHSAGYFANLTIDDPWLTEPYGHLNFRGILEQMQQHDFHTTLAFIPWNFARSEPPVVELFKQHPDKFSLCIHGNNHDHREFDKYKTEKGDAWTPRKLAAHDVNIRQALARMEEMKSLTGLSYDSVMVFPHNIAPEQTLGLLRKYNFLATLNFGNIPIGSTRPTDPVFYLRNANLLFANFLSLNRLSMKHLVEGDIAIQLFLGNPLFFFTHHDFLEDGVDAFNHIADTVNKIESDIEWRSLGQIIRRSYLQRVREDGDYEIEAFSNCIGIENKHGRDMAYHVRKEERFDIPIKAVQVNGRRHPYQRIDNKLQVTVTVPAGETCRLFIEYENDLNVETVDVGRTDFRADLLRWLSDFRDMTLTTNKVGRTFVRFYYDALHYRLGPTSLLIMSVLFFSLLILLTWILRRKSKTP